MNIELIGLPGVGKSYLCNQIAEAAKAHGLAELKTTPCVDEMPKLKAYGAKVSRAVRFAMRHPRVAGKIRRILKTSGQSDRRQLLTKTINLYSELHRSNGKNGATLVSEQGVIQAVWSLALRSKKPIAGELLLTVRAWLPDTCAMVECEREEHLRRLGSRANGQSRYDGVSNEKLEAEIDHGAALLDEILATRNAMQPQGKTVRLRSDAEFDGERLITALS